MKNFQRKQAIKEAGFIGIVFLVIALIGIVIAAIAAMSRNNSSEGTSSAVKSVVATMMKQATDLKSGFDMMLTTGIDPATITFDATATGIYNPAAGAKYALKQFPPKNVVVSTATPNFTYNNAVTLPGIASNGTADAVVTVGDLTLAACQMVNNLIYNDGINAAPAVSAGALAAWSTAPAAINDSSLTGTTNYNGRPEGCVATSDSKYVYYKAVIEN